MYFTGSLNDAALKELNRLTGQYAADKKAFTVLSDVLEKKKLAAYQSTTAVHSNTMALGACSTVNTQSRLPHDFHIKNQKIIEEVEGHRQIMSDSRAALSVFKYDLIQAIAKEKVEQYESLAEYISEAHAIIAAIEKYEGNLNSGLWNKIAIPAGTNINRLRQRAEQPLGAAMLHYGGKAQRLTDKYQAELKEFLAID